MVGRQTSDNIVLAQEVTHSLRKKTRRKGFMVAKLDLERLMTGLT